MGRNGGADWYAKEIDGWRREGALSLQVFLAACAEEGVEPRKHCSGQFSLRVDPATHAAAVIAAASHGPRLNPGATAAIRQAASAG